MSEKNLATTLCSETIKPENVFDEIKTIRKAKIMKWSHVLKNYAHTYNVEIFISFNPELQLNNAEFIIKNKLKNLLNEMRGF